MSPNNTKTFAHGRVAREFMLFVIIGCLSFVVNYGLFFVSIQTLHISYMVASALGYCAGVFVSYFGNKIITFNAGRTFSNREFSIFLTVYLFSLCVSLLALYCLVTFFGSSPFYGNIIAIGISTILNFTGVKIFLFKQTS